MTASLSLSVIPDMHNDKMNNTHNEHEKTLSEIENGSDHGRDNKLDRIATVDVDNYHGLTLKTVLVYLVRLATSAIKPKTNKSRPSMQSVSPSYTMLLAQVFWPAQSPRLWVAQQNHNGWLKGLSS